MAYYRNHEPMPPSFIGIGILLLILLYILNSCISSATYNNGICSYCGGHYVYSQAVGHRYSTDYIYICDTCGRSIEVAEHYTEVNNE